MTSKHKLVALCAIVVLVAIPVVAYAYSGSFSFDMTDSVFSSYSHSLVANAAVDITAKADEYTSNYVKVSPSEVTKQYQIYIQRSGSLLSWPTTVWNCDGKNHSYTYAASRIIAGSYRVKAVVVDPDSNRAIGDGSITQ